MTSLVQHITIDCADAYELALFWAEVLGSSLSDDDRPGDPEALVAAPGAALLFVTVPESKSVKNRIHLDLRPEDRGRDAEVERLLALGATLVGDHRRPDGRGWATMADPEGNEFCVECGAAERAALNGTRMPVTADDVALAVRLAVDTLGESEARDWRVPAGSLEWNCWETVEHLGDDLFAYAVQLGLRKPPTGTEVPYRWAAEREGGPANSVFADPAAGSTGLLQTLEASGSLLTAMVRTALPDVRSHHVFGLSDPEGFAAMGVVETLVHTHDVAEGLSLSWTPPADLCDRALARLFPDAPDDADRWTVLLWSTGRADLPGRDRVTSWRWHGAPL
ncbi:MULTISPECIES: VOC family protein [Streptomyces]|uniref:Enzyme related to lactoylglutathione lyase n=1 Tax=Streptomyces clavifer TaxID=68188 RepID=A0ABS4VDU6_9ACTN|nr:MULTISPECIES: VOC family protein [Streptomyces]KQX79657.1 glyoxalase [Streptomyces sp. Root1319]KQZ20828.1 glyoxalase [Streptomyces sp. Root55]MBP2362088.1 putative enzyme related to lactoylglutathione lyase [Streptomyces clavifer]MDX2746562.1 VOC family protein [Streptomyces sp. NRRL_B-2557]MDX3064128.1 VOC family protein [Streptomyces sp. ND04-05B]